MVAEICAILRSEEVAEDVLAPLEDRLLALAVDEEGLFRNAHIETDIEGPSPDSIEHALQLYLPEPQMQFPDGPRDTPEERAAQPQPSAMESLQAGCPASTPHEDVIGGHLPTEARRVDSGPSHANGELSEEEASSLQIWRRRVAPVSRRTSGRAAAREAVTERNEQAAAPERHSRDEDSAEEEVVEDSQPDQLYILAGPEDSQISSTTQEEQSTEEELSQPPAVPHLQRRTQPSAVQQTSRKARPANERPTGGKHVIRPVKRRRNMPG
jgi:hypothetical protein